MKYFYLILILFNFSLNTLSQIDSIHNYSLKTKEDVYIGKILKDDSREILILTKKLGKIYIAKTEIINIMLVDDTIKTKNYVDNKNSVSFTDFKYLISFSAVPIKRGKFISQVNLWGPELHIGLGKGFVFSYLSSWLSSPFGLGIKKSFLEKNNNWKISTGLFYGNLGFWNNYKSNTGMFYSNLSYINKRIVATISGAVNISRLNMIRDYTITYKELGIDTINYDNTDYYYANVKYNRPLEPTYFASLSCKFKINRKLSLYFEAINSFSQITTPKNIIQGNVISSEDLYNYKLKESDINKKFNYYGIYIYGLRYMYKENVTFQTNAILITDFQNMQTYPIPLISWIIKL